MQNLLYVFNCALKFLNTSVLFPPFRFTFFQFFIAVAIGGIIVSFIRDLFF